MRKFTKPTKAFWSLLRSHTQTNFISNTVVRGYRSLTGLPNSFTCLLRSMIRVSNTFYLVSTHNSSPERIWVALNLELQPLCILELFTTEHLEAHSRVTTLVFSIPVETLGNLDQYKSPRLPLGFILSQSYIILVLPSLLTDKFSRKSVIKHILPFDSIHNLISIVLMSKQFHIFTPQWSHSPRVYKI